MRTISSNHTVPFLLTTSRFQNLEGSPLVLHNEWRKMKRKWKCLWLRYIRSLAVSWRSRRGRPHLSHLFLSCLWDGPSIMWVIPLLNVVLIQVTLTLFLFHRVYFFLSLSCYRYSYCICEYLPFMVSGVKDNSADYLQNHYDHVDHLPFVRITCGGCFANANFLTDGDECIVYDTKLNANLFFPHPLHCQPHLTPLYLTRLTLQGRPYWSPSRLYKMALVPLLWPTLYLPAQRRNRYSPLIRKWWWRLWTRRCRMRRGWSLGSLGRIMPMPCWSAGK